ncbi:aryl-sulfate sulfotransferase [Pseudomonas sp. Marseille-QA0892]
MNVRLAKSLVCSTLLVMTMSHSAVGAVDSCPDSRSTLVHDRNKAFDGFVLFDGSDGKTHLIDLTGREVNRWPYSGFPSVPVPPQRAHGAKGHVLVRLSDVSKPHELAAAGNGLLNRSVGEVDWNGNVIWRWGDEAKPAYQHHDMQKLPSGNTLILTSALTPLEGFAVPEVIDDVIREVDAEGREVWQWRLSDHLDALGFTPEQLALVKGWDDPDFMHLNTLAPLGPNRWFDAGDARFAPDNLMVNSRSANLALIIDRRTGEIVWRLGPNYPKARLAGPVPRPIDQIVGAHDVHMIPPGLPGAGNILIFDNQGNAGFPPAYKGIFSASRILEIDPQSMDIVWQYTAIDSGRAPWTFFSAFISNARRLPNGNTLINEGQNGRVFQVTPDGEIAWEYVSPYTGKTMPTDRYETNRIYRAEMVDKDWVPEGKSQRCKTRDNEHD